MSTDLILRRSEHTEPLKRATLVRALQQISELSEIKASLHEGESAIRFRIAFDATDRERAAVAIRLSRSGAEVIGTSKGQSAPLLYWCFCALAEELKANLSDPKRDDPEKGWPPAAFFFDAARIIVEAHEQDVSQSRAYRGQKGFTYEDDGEVFPMLLRFLVEKEKIVLADRPPSELVTLGALIDSPDELYEALLECDDVADVFVEEAEFVETVMAFREHMRS